jgi:enoyl-CoA hydratase/carnithine racemase
VLTGYDRFFSAGLDLPTVSTCGRDTLGAFMGRFESVMDRIFALPRPVVAAAVSGQAVAEGCVLAAQADHRVLAAQAAREASLQTWLDLWFGDDAQAALAAAVASLTKKS